MSMLKDRTATTKKLKEGRLSRKYRNALANIWIAALFVSVGALVAYWLKVGRAWPVGDTTDLWGQFGDFLGGVVGTIVAGATLALVGVTVLIQIQVMNLAMRQLKDSKRELSLTREEMKQSNTALRQQTFEATFFRLLEQFRTYAMVLRTGKQTGPDAFASLAQSVKDRYVSGEFAGLPRQQVEAAYQRVYGEREAWLGPYFRMLYHLYKLIHSSFPRDDDRRNLYGSMVRAQLSRGELLMIFYNLMDVRSTGLVPYVEFYGMLKHLDRDGLAVEESALGYVVAESAFRNYEWRQLNAIRPDTEIGL